MASRSLHVDSTRSMARFAEEVPSTDGEGWTSGALDADYCAFDPSLLATNERLCDELMFAAHLMSVPNETATEVRDENRDDINPASDNLLVPDLAAFVEASADAFALDRSCLVCRLIDTYKKKFGLTSQWIADYAMLCNKCLAAPPCATTTFIAAFELVYIMDKHFLATHRTTLTGSFARRVLTLNDVQRHFFLHGCCRTDGGIPGSTSSMNQPLESTNTRITSPMVQARTSRSTKVLFSNYSFLAQTATRTMLMTLADNSSNDVQNNGTQRTNYYSSGHHSTLTALPGQPSLAAALAGWKECAKHVECHGSAASRSGVGQKDSCATLAYVDDDAFEMHEELRLERERERAKSHSMYARPKRLATRSKPARDENGATRVHGTGPSEQAHREDWAYADLTLLLLVGTGAIWELNDTTNTVLLARRNAVARYWRDHKRALARETAPKFSRFAENDAEPVTSLGPVLATTLKHTRCKSRTGGECILCNLLPIRTYWLAIRRLKRDIVAHSANNLGLFDCIAPVIDTWSEGEYEEIADGGRFVAMVKAAGAEAVYKHLFCDPMCALCELQTNPRVLFDHPTKSDPDALNLYKAHLASENCFEGRICAGLWALAYTFKTYQIFPPKPTALASFIRDAGLLLRKHSISLVSLEHTLGTYV
ncbi:UL32 [anatid alphaherpesvirus 1]|nr:UL32 [Anatid alphaherpesvirus 1]